MKNVTKLASVSALALLIAAPAFSQGALVGIDDLDDRIEDIQEDIDEDMSEGDDKDRFGTNQFTQGWSGSASVGLTATSGNTDTVDLSLAGRLRYGNGPWNHSIGFLAELAEDNNVRNKEEAFLTYEANRYLTENFYIFGLGSLGYDGFDTNKWDAFLGAGPGYRIINQPNATWRVQAGPGVRYLEDQLGNDTTEVAGIASSRVFYKISETAFLTNDTDVLFSDDNATVVNDIGVTVKVSDRVATRVGLRTEWDSDPLPGLDDTDNSLNVSLVLSF
jgi:putative salt-induced outer membrane protein